MMTVEKQLEEMIINLLDKRADGATISPSDAARRVGGPRWRSLEAPARRAAQNLSVNGQVVMSTNGKLVRLRPRF